MGGGPEMAYGPKKLPYDEGDPVPPGYHVDTSVRKGLVIGGAATFGAIYLVTALTAGLIQSVSSSVDGGDAEEVTPLYIPVAGPFVAMATLDATGGGIVALALLGVGQAAGVGMFITGFAAQESVLMRNDVGAAQKPRIRLSPTVGKGDPGLSLVGSF